MSEAPERIWADGNAKWTKGSWGRYREFDNDVEYVRADRIEELEAERRKTFQALLKVTKIHDEVEAKLAKAVEALGNVVGEYDLFRKDEYERGLSPLDDEIHDARIILAELKGEDRG